MDENLRIKFKPKTHTEYLKRILGCLPNYLSTVDSQRIVISYFAISGLDILNELDNNISKAKKDDMINWIYSLQVLDDEELVSGFQGSSTLNTSFNKNSNSKYKWSHIATTYTALANLIILGDNLERVHRDSIVKSLRTLQLPSGCYTAAKEGTEHDMRFIYCAACISYILDDWSGMDIDKTTDFILKSISYDFGIGQGPELESHCGSTFCALATLSLTGRLYRLSARQRAGITRWLLNRLEFGFNGRPNKPTDTCYSFWTGGALQILGAYHYIEAADNDQFVLVAQDKYGGFSKWPNSVADPLHTYLGLAGLSIMKRAGLNAIYPVLNISERAHRHLQSLHELWRS